MNIEFSQDTSYDFDLFVIGGGSGGIKAATSAAKLGARVAVADYVVPSPQGTKWGIGGTCINVGCIPKKLFHHASLLGDSREEFENAGWELPDYSQQKHNWKKMVAVVNKYIRSLRWNAKLALSDRGIKYFNMLASFVDSHTLELYDPQKQKKQIVSAKYILIAVGGRPSYPDNVLNAKELAITSDDIFTLEEAPGKTLVVGASYIALETAGFLTGFGHDVTVMVRSILLRGFDQTVATKIGEFMESKGTKFIRQAIPEKIEKLENGKKRVTYVTSDSIEHSEEFDTVLFAIGRTANTAYLNLEAAGVSYHRDNKKVITNESDQTNIDNIFSIGDSAYGRPELTPPAVMAGQLLSERLFGNSTQLMNYKFIATTVFTPLEYGSIGYSEEDAIKTFGKNNISAYHSVFKPLEWNFSEALAESAGYVKMICKKDENERVIGLHYLGPNGGEVIQGFSVAVNVGARREDFAKTVGIHPTVAEELLDLSLPTDQEPSAAGVCKGCGF